MSINTTEAQKAWKNYQGDPNKNRWDFANQALYDLCSRHPQHNNADEIVAKVWMIGRCYAADVKRTPVAKNVSGCFYYDNIAPAIKKQGQALDSLIDKINQGVQQGTNVENLVLNAHGMLVNIFKSVTKRENRSLASKYLHFHCPQAVFIFDSDASGKIKTLVKANTKSGKNKVYVDFYKKATELKKYYENEYKVNLTPREMDKLLREY